MFWEYIEKGQKHNREEREMVKKNLRGGRNGPKKTCEEGEMPKKTCEEGVMAQKNVRGGRNRGKSRKEGKRKCWV